MNTSSSTLETQAIQAAKSQDWKTAIECNEAIIAADPSDINAFIRLGVAYAQISENKKAETAFKQALELDKSNQLVKKHLNKLKNHQSISLSSLPSDEQFIEEPGKTKTVDLHRLASKEQLEQFAVGQICELKPKNRFISVEVGKTYVGSLPDDLSSRLTKFMKTGNQYTCYIHSISSTSCSVFIKETLRSPENEFTNSFLTTKSQMNALNDNMYLADENIPLQLDDVGAARIVIVDTDTDVVDTALDSFTLNDDHQMEETPEEPEA